MKIISYSDVITNSSSEVFVLHAKPEFQDVINNKVPKLLDQICELLGYEVEEVLECYPACKSGVDEDWYYYTSENDLIIASASDNTIPYWLMDFIEDIYSLPEFQDMFSGYYAEDLGEKEIPYIDWNAPYEQREKTRVQKIKSIQRIHEG